MNLITPTKPSLKISDCIKTKQSCLMDTCGSWVLLPLGEWAALQSAIDVI